MTFAEVSHLRRTANRIERLFAPSLLNIRIDCDTIGTFDNSAKNTYELSTFLEEKQDIPIHTLLRQELSSDSSLTIVKFIDVIIHANWMHCLHTLFIGAAVIHMQYKCAHKGKHNMDDHQLHVNNVFPAAAIRVGVPFTHMHTCSLTTISILPVHYTH